MIVAACSCERCALAFVPCATSFLGTREAEPNHVRTTTTPKPDQHTVTLPIHCPRNTYCIYEYSISSIPDLQKIRRQQTPQVSHFRNTMTQTFFDKLEAWEHSVTPCDSPACPVKLAHSQGRYLHNGKHNRHGPVFGSCNPPPDVWQAYDRTRAGNGTAEDMQLVESFREYHVFQGHARFGNGRPGRCQWRSVN